MIGIANTILQPINSSLTFSQISFILLSPRSLFGIVSLNIHTKKKPNIMKKVSSPSCIVLNFFIAISLMNTGTVTLTIPVIIPLRTRPVHKAAKCCIIIIDDDMITSIFAIISIFRRPYFKK